jgi:hypothetical protein
MASPRDASRRSASLPILLILALSVTLLVAAEASAGSPRCQGRPATHVGTQSADVLRGTTGDDVIVARGGDDRVIGRGGHDRVCAGGGDDVLKGGGGDDALLGQGGDDRLIGGAGSDELNGGSGEDDCVSGETLAGCEPSPPGSGIDGSWVGTTSQGLPITFTVENHGLAIIAVRYSWSGSGCTHEATTEIDYADTKPIDGNGFDVDVAIITLVLDIHGEFSSDTEATGSFAVAEQGPPCPGGAQGTWSASRE